MTLCIAATCLNDVTDCKMGDSAIVLCADAMVTAGASSSETGYKREEIGPYVGLFSGCVSEAYELLSAYRDHLAANPLQDPFSRVERLAQLRQPLEDHKWRKLDHLVRMRIGLSYDDFLKRRDQLDPQILTPLLAHIWALSVDVDLLLAGIAPGTSDNRSVFDRAFIFRSTGEDLEFHKNFACIGEGALAAEPALHRREQSEITFLKQTLYNVYESKKMGEIASSVGKRTMLAVIEPSDNGNAWQIRELSREAQVYLEDCFKRYGPQPVSHGTISFPEDPFSKPFVLPSEAPPETTASE